MELKDINLTYEKLGISSEDDRIKLLKNFEKINLENSYLNKNEEDFKIITINQNGDDKNAWME